jgi:hypothetical protein
MQNQLRHNVENTPNPTLAKFQAILGDLTAKALDEEKRRQRFLDANFHKGTVYGWLYPKHQDSEARAESIKASLNEHTSYSQALQVLGDTPLAADTVLMLLAKYGGFDGDKIKAALASINAAGRAKVLENKATAKEKRRLKAQAWYDEHRKRFTTKDRAAEELAGCLGIEFKPARALIKELDDYTAEVQRGTLSTSEG